MKRSVLIACLSCLLVLAGCNATIPSKDHTPGNNVYLVHEAKRKAPVVTVYEDLSCPDCRDFEKVFNQRFRQMANDGDIELRYKILTFMGSEDTAVGMAAANAVGKGIEYHDAVFANWIKKPSESQIRQDFPKASGIVGGDFDKFQHYYDDPAVRDGVHSSASDFLREGEKLSDDFGTPFITVNGKEWEQWDGMGKKSKDDILKAIQVQAHSSSAKATQ
jgi:lipoprotein